MRTLLVDQAFCVIDAGQVNIARLPMDYWESLPAMAGRAYARMDAACPTLLLSGPAARELGLPDGPDKATTPPPEILGRDGEVMRCQGGKWRPWMEWATPKREQRLFVGVLPWMNRADMPLLQKFPEDTERVIDLWREVTGTPWFGAPAAAGAMLLRATAKTRDEKGRPRDARFQLTPPPGETPQLWAECELTDHWTRKAAPEEGPYRHTFDVRRAWLAAAHLAIVAPEQLKHTGDRITEYEPRTAGLFLVRPYPWDHEYAGLLPDPAGPTPAGEPRWISHARLGLLDQLRKAGEHPGYEILDSYTAPGTELLRPWSTALEDAFRTEELSSAVKAVYARTPSSMGTPPYFNEQTNRYEYRSIYRPDWKAQIIGLAEVNKWRALWKAGKTSKRWPIAIAEDQPTYASAEPDGTADGLSIGILQMDKDGQLDPRRGKFKLKGTKMLGEAA